MTVLSGDQDSSLDLACSIYTFNIFWTEFLLQVIYVAHCDDLFNKKYTYNIGQILSHTESRSQLNPGFSFGVAWDLLRVSDSRPRFYIK